MLDLSPKQITAFQKSNSRLNIFEGAVRSGKSFVSLIRFLKAVRDCPEGAGIVVGRTDKTIYRNIVMPLQELCGDVVKYHSGKGQMELFNRTVFVVGANDDRAEGKIRGSEFAFALVDELTLIPENFIKMLFSRLSVEGAQFFATTNPDSPFHWVRRELLDRRDELDLQVFSFKLDDNPSLSQSYKDALNKEYRGLWHKRFIEGAWVQADGAVFDFFDERTHVIDRPPGPADYYILGIDYGTLNPCAFSMIGVNETCYPKMWLEKEYYYDGRKTNRQKSDYEYAQDFVGFIRGYHVKRIYIDPSAASFRRELQREGIRDLVDADNRVLDGIRFVSNELCSGSFKVCSNCVNAIREFQTYVWDEKASNRGEDKPVKENDHILDSLRYALYTHFFKSSRANMKASDAYEMQRKWGSGPAFY